MKKYEEAWIYVGVRYVVENHEGVFYTMEHLELKNSNGELVYEERRETEVDFEGHSEFVSVTPIRYAISRMRHDIPGDEEYMATLTVTDQESGATSDPYSTTFEVPQ